MAVSLSSPVTGGAQTGFSSPTYTVTSDTALDSFSRQYAVTALGGTQTGVTANSVSSPFTFTIRRPPTFKQVGVANPATGVIYPSGKNVWKLIIRKGCTPAANQNSIVGMWHSELGIPAGADTYDAANVRALVSFGVGCFNQVSAGLGDSLTDGIM